MSDLAPIGSAAATDVGIAAAVVFFVDPGAVDALVVLKAKVVGGAATVAAGRVCLETDQEYLRMSMRAMKTAQHNVQARC
jgi:hypothetical protein